MTKSAAEKILSDPDNHYPYKYAAAVDAGTPLEVADACRAVVEAQEAYLRDPSDDNLQARNEAERAAQQIASARRGRMRELSDAVAQAIRPATVSGSAEVNE